MIATFQNMFRIPELRKRILFTLGILVVYRVGCHVPTPGVDPSVLVSWFERAGKGSLFGLYNLFAGGAFAKATIFSLGIMPYISASIIMQLLGAVIPYFQKLQKEGEEGRRKITQYTRYGTVLLSAMQALGVSAFLESIKEGGVSAVARPGFIEFTLPTIITFSCGTVLIMWLGEQITERGIGNGISLIIFIGIVARFPSAIIDEFNNIRLGERNILTEVVMIAFMVLVIAAVVAVTAALRKIPVQYAKRIV
ncbi:MAG TPA: preprotein translocase subunit SecY, partial [candidate division Zixibacteria bacterium]